MTSEKAPAKEAEDNGDSHPKDIVAALAVEAQVSIQHFNSSCNSYRTSYIFLVGQISALFFPFPPNR